MRNVEVGRVSEAVLTIDLLYFGEQGPHRPVVRNVHIENVTSRSSPRVMWVVGFPGVTIDDIRFRNCTFRGVEAAEVVDHTGTFSFENVTIEPAKKGRSLNSPQGTPQR
jgi:unsaturated rhamnogalacturonyl hydrolase